PRRYSRKFVRVLAQFWFASSQPSPTKPKLCWVTMPASRKVAMWRLEPPTCQRASRDASKRPLPPSGTRVRRRRDSSPSSPVGGEVSGGGSGSRGGRSITSCSGARRPLEKPRIDEGPPAKKRETIGETAEGFPSVA